MRNTNIRLLLISALVINVAIAAKAPQNIAEADLTSATKKDLKAEVIFQTVPEGLKITADATGLTPNSTHGFHVHKVGKCEGPDYKSAGDHFNPTNMQHGSPKSEKSHMGDMGNLVANAKGEAHMEMILKKDEAKDLKEFAGKSVVIHAKADDFKSQPAGDSGARIACGLIKFN
ncbi:superoxide dismutase family protein [Peredibacter starrii]|uniref:Superoxide dismutase [Cu-Zn] n=1 Tax=Peredibacter starrii TaxID=28202 RepID=A0AAX4HK04_9BACT|nr:superoxide dismutase family protein [Peredibacter starrii]WPU63525.1 superoxide dismutase family protein [Peredibacter starrii]